MLHSGTVGAALTAANFGISGLATSIATGDPSELATAVLLATAALAWLVDAPARTVLNLNVPNLSPARVRGVRNALASRWHIRCGYVARRCCCDDHSQQSLNC